MLNKVIIKNHKKKSFFATLEAIDKKAILYYKEKFSFKILGTKIRFFKSLKILYKKI